MKEKLRKKCQFPILKMKKENRMNDHFNGKEIF
jgi:hypothetical protein